MKKIGILVKYHKSLFTNGCIQQGYYLYKLLNKISDCELITTCKNFTKFGISDTPVNYIDSSKQLDNYSIIIFSSAIIDNYSYLSYCKIAGIKLVNLMVGNYYFINQEEIIFNKHDIISTMNNNFIDEIWMMPMYKHNKQYVEFMTGKKVVIVPYIWDPEIVDLYSKEKQLNIQYSHKQLDKINIIIMEPNISIHKTCLVPLLIANSFFKKHPDKLSKVYLFCKPNTDYKEKLKFLEIIKFNLVEDFGRYVSLEIFHNLNSDLTNYVILSSNIRNNLNFLHLEAFYLGIPIIHNCEPFKDNGLYYSDNDSDNDYQKAVEYIIDILNRSYKTDNKEILNRYGISNKKSIEKYKNLINQSSKSILDLIAPKIIAEYTQKYEGNAIVFYQQDTYFSEKILYKNLNNILKYSKYLDIVVFTRKPINFSDIIKASLNIKTNIIPDKYYKNVKGYCMSYLNYNRVFLTSIQSIINFDISPFYNLDFLIYPFLRKDIDIDYNIYKTQQWLVKTLLLKFGNKTNSVELLSNSFVYYVNSPLLTNILKSFIDLDIDLDIIINFSLAYTNKSKKNFENFNYYILDKNNNYIGKSIICDNLPVFLHFKKEFNCITKFIKADSFLEFHSKESSYYNLKFKEKNIFKYDI